MKLKQRICAQRGTVSSTSNKGHACILGFDVFKLRDHHILTDLIRKNGTNGIQNHTVYSKPPIV